MAYLVVIKSSHFAPTLSLILLLLLKWATCEKKSDHDLPKVWLKSYMQADGADIVRAEQEFHVFEDYSNDLIVKNGSVYSFLSDVNKAYFVCAASYPVQWTIPIPEQFNIFDLDLLCLQTGGERQSRFDEDSAEPTNQMFYALLQLHLLPSNFISGNFTCKPTGNTGNRNSTKTFPGIYVFSESKNEIQFMGETLQVNLTGKDETVVLPCRPALPSMEVSLFKKRDGDNKEGDKDDASNEWTELAMESISFDPIIGFTLDTRVISDVRGLYKCELTDDVETFVLVNVSTAAEKLSPNLPTFHLKQNITDLMSNITARKDYWKCCSTDDFISVSHFDCSNQNDCDLLKPVWMHDYMLNTSKVMQTYKLGNSPDQHCIPVDVFFASQVVICQSPVMDVAAQYIAVYDDDEDVKNGGSDHFHWSGKNRKHLYDVSQPNEPSMKEKITFRVASPMNNSNYRANPGSAVAYVFHSSSLEKLYDVGEVNDERGREVKYLTQHVGDIFEGEDIFVVCFSLRFYYARGGWLRLKWKNGTKTLLDGDLNGEEDEVSYMGSSVEKDNTVISGIIKAHLNMRSIECHVPRLTSDKWEMREFQLRIQRSEPPILTNAQEESLTLKLYQEGADEQLLNCTLSAGKPTPTIRWEKDGRTINWQNHANVVAENMELDGGKRQFIVRFLNVTQELHGTYQCIAENVKGSMVKTFNIHVSRLKEGFLGTEFSTSFIAVIVAGATVIACLLLIIICLTVKRFKK